MILLTQIYTKKSPRETLPLRFQKSSHDIEDSARQKIKIRPCGCAFKQKNRGYRLGCGSLKKYSKTFQNPPLQLKPLGIVCFFLRRAAAHGAPLSSKVQGHGFLLLQNFCNAHLAPLVVVDQRILTIQGVQGYRVVLWGFLSTSLGFQKARYLWNTWVFAFKSFSILPLVFD